VRASGFWPVPDAAAATEGRNGAFPPQRENGGKIMWRLAKYFAFYKMIRRAFRR
jgi:hypothetical protein